MKLALIIFNQAMQPSLLPAIASFALVARHGSFRKAADEIDVSPSALSQTIRGLEEKLNVRLFNRTTRSVSLTEQGQHFLDQVAPGLAKLELGIKNLEEERDYPAGELRINLSRFASQNLIEPHLGEFSSKYPHIRLELVLDDGLANVVAERCDAGIRLGEHLLQDMVAVPVSPRLHMTVVGAPKYFLKHARPLTPDDLHNHNCIRFRKSSNGTIYRWELSDPEIPFRPVEFDPKGSFTTNDHDAMIRAAVQGVGLMQHISAAVERYVQRGELIPVLEEWCQPFPGFYLYAPSRAMMPIKLRVFIDFLKEKML